MYSSAASAPPCSTPKHSSSAIAGILLDEKSNSGSLDSDGAGNTQGDYSSQLC